MSTVFQRVIRRTASGRHVSLRIGGEGPPAVLLHESPRSSAALMPLSERLAARFTVYAFDNPGFGHSDPLAHPRPAAEDFAAALIESFDLLGIDRAPVYGTHTGAVIAMAAGLGYPQRVTALALDGYPIFRPTEREEYLASYLAPFRPEWDGTHLAWLWGRVRDQFTFFPWNRRGPASRLPRPMAPLALRQAVALDFLMAGDAYRPAYASAFRYPALPPVREIAVPTTFLCRSDDLLFQHLDRLADIAPVARIERLGADRDLWGAAVGNAMARGGSGRVAALPADREGAGCHLSRVPGGGLAWQAWSGSGAPLLLLHDLPGSARGIAALAQALAHVTGRPVIAPDLPGFGLSTLGEAPVATDMATALLALPAGPDAEVITVGASAAVGVALGGYHLAIDPIAPADAPMLLERFADLTPREDGAHLFGAWYQLRDAELWQPWYRPEPVSAIDTEPDRDVGRLNDVLADWMEGGTQGRATLGACLGSKAVGARTTVVQAPRHSPWARARLLATALTP